MFDAGAAETDSRTAAAQQLAATLAHVVIGRVIPLLVLEGRAWDTGLENLWVHVDSEGAIDWLGVVDPTLRALPDDPFFAGGTRRHGRTARDGIVALPSEAALTTWIAHRSHRALAPLFDKLDEVSGGAVPHRVDVAHGRRRCGARPPRCRCWRAPARCEHAARRRRCSTRWSGFGLPVRGTSASATREGLAKLGQPCLSLTAMKRRNQRTEPES